MCVEERINQWKYKGGGGKWNEFVDGGRGKRAAGRGSVNGHGKLTATTSTPITPVAYVFLLKNLF